MKSLHLFLLLSLTLWGSFIDFKDASVAFKQTVTNDQNRTLTYSGILHMKVPSHIVWEYQTPVVKKIYIAKKHVTVYEPDLLQATIFKSGKELNPITIFNESKQVDTTTRKVLFDKREIVIKHNKKEIESLHFLDEVENRVAIRFTHYNYTPTFNKDFFIFYPDSETDVIRP
jgi:outer membrane lipoprotein carrier protein